MKNILIGLLAFGSMSAFANEFYTVSVDMQCELSGDVQSISRNKEVLPEKILFSVNVTERRYLKNKKAKVAKRTVTLSDNSPFSIKKAELETYGYLKIQFEDLTANEFMEVLEQLGNTTTTAPYAGIKGIRIGIDSDYLTSEHYKGNSSFYRNFVKQVHYPLKQNDGLSYHLKLTCGQF